MSQSDAEEARELLSLYAPALVRLLDIEPTCLDVALAQPLEHWVPGREAMAETLAARLSELGPEDEAGLYRTLRLYRHSAIIRIALREIRSLADVRHTSEEMALLAAVVIDAALEAALAVERARHGTARDESGEAVPICVLGMGKLGGWELNLGSDIDLIFFYSSDAGGCDGSDMSIHEHFTRVIRRLTRILGDVTEDGFCFRVDLRLRPEGSRGPLVNSLASAERYYESWGRTWERAALLRASPVAGDLAFGGEMLEALRGFIYRRSVDLTLAAQMNEMLLRSRRELRVSAQDIKLARGGIREAEFFVQTLQLIWGGHYPEVRRPETLEALRRLHAAGLVSDRESDSLESGWALLRRIEHRIHVFSGYQTHVVPDDPRFAVSLGYADSAALQADLERTRAEIAELFDSLLPDSSADPVEERPWEDVLDGVAAGDPVDVIAKLLEARLPDIDDPHEAAANLLRLGRRAYDPLGPYRRQRSPAIGRLLLTEVSDAADPGAALFHLAEFFGRLGGRWSYERLLLERPRLTRRLVGLFGVSATLSRALIGHPEDVDLVLSSSAPSVAEIREIHENAEVSANPELLVAELRRIKRELTLQIGLAYAAGELKLEEATDHLSELAVGQVRLALAGAFAWTAPRWRPVDGELDGGLVIGALGKLGGHELGFGGDLDLMFIYRSERRADLELYTRVAQRTMRLLREPDKEGAGYETDTRLRPSGSKGTLVVSVDAFDAYHARGAASWERQALVRGRVIAGDEVVAVAVEERFHELAYERDPTPREELAHNRARLQAELAGETPRRYHPKLGFGGLMDVELLVQREQMAHAAPSTNTFAAIDALETLHLRGRGGLTSQDASVLREGYRFLRRAEQSLKLLDENREPMLEPAGRTGAHVARSLGLRARDGLRPAEVLEATYRLHTTAIRDCFEALIGPVGQPAPWEGRSDG